MPMMKPPAGFKGVSYNGLDVPAGGEVNVLPADVAAHLAQGWTLSGSITVPADAPVVVRFEPEDVR